MPSLAFLIRGRIVVPVQLGNSVDFLTAHEIFQYHQLDHPICLIQLTILKDNLIVPILSVTINARIIHIVQFKLASQLLLIYL